MAFHRFTISILFYCAQHNDGAKREEVHGIRVIEAFEYKNTRSDFKCCDYREKWKTICQTTVSIPGTLSDKGSFSDKVAPDIDDFTDKPEIQCDAQVVKNTFLDDFK